jgi:hypothetical protein
LCGSGSGSTHGFKIQPEPAPVGLKTRGLPETRTRIAIPREEILAMGFILWFVLAISYIIKSNNNVAFSVYSVRKHY